MVVMRVGVLSVSVKPGAGNAAAISAGNPMGMRAAHEHDGCLNAASSKAAKDEFLRRYRAYRRCRSRVMAIVPDVEQQVLGERVIGP